MNKIKILLIIAIIFIAKAVSAQTYDLYGNEINRFQFIVKGGLTLSNTTKLSAGQSGKESIAFGYNAGLLADIYLDGGIYLQTGVDLTTKGSRIKKFTMSENKQTGLRMNMLYLQVPLLFVFKIPVANTGEDSFNFAIGPYYAYGLDGKIKGRKKGSGFETLKTFGDDGVCKDSDWGMILQAQFETSKIFVSYGAEIGLVSIMKKESLPAGFNKKIKNYGFGASIGYKF
ncbi:porin family protein [Dysgonomonas massiliensis]|uniref:porin family protein n=1 Tax=Dysgonomonas massiliensis TaxID=2040292 RepID=UPI000C78E0A3|nr:porin family protein [Dysgonomonas massiliensis]